MMGYDFHRQKPIDQYIVDFYCPRLDLAIEIDGDSHIFKEKRDKERQQRLEKLGIRFLRFDDLDVKFQMDKVLDTIREWIIRGESSARNEKGSSPNQQQRSTHSPLSDGRCVGERGIRRGVLKSRDTHPVRLPPAQKKLRRINRRTSPLARARAHAQRGIMYNCRVEGFLEAGLISDQGNLHLDSTILISSSVSPYNSYTRSSICLSVSSIWRCSAVCS